MLHITNGESAAGGIRTAGVPGEVLSWIDVLHDGPVPGDVSFNQLRAVRARFISDCGWRPFEEALREFTERDRALEKALSRDEIVLWFEHDLYDQLQLLQLLDWFATCELGATKLSMICDAEYLGPSAPPRLAERFPAREPVTEAQIELARRAWAAFRMPDPTAIEAVIREDSPGLPFVHAALKRHLEQFPSTTNGLSRTERQALEVLANGPATLGDAFVKTNAADESMFLGDASFAIYMAGLSSVAQPLVLTSEGARLATGPSRALWHSTVEITAAGREVLAGNADHVELNGIDRWYGGVHLEGQRPAWRWDPFDQRLSPTE
jgi:hypothetical protein